MCIYNRNDTCVEFVVMYITQTPCVDFKSLEHEMFNFPMIRPNLDMSNPYTMSRPPTKCKLPWEFSIWCNWNPIITILLWGIPPDTSNPVYQMWNFHGISYLVQLWRPCTKLWISGNFLCGAPPTIKQIGAVQSLPRTAHMDHGGPAWSSIGTFLSKTVFWKKLTLYIIDGCLRMCSIFQMWSLQLKGQCQQEPHRNSVPGSGPNDPISFFLTQIILDYLEM